MDTSSSITQRKACITCTQEFEGQEDTCPFDGTKLTIISVQLTPGTVLGGRYEIIAMVADGGMGKVYKARHKFMNRLVAIKTMLSSVVSSGTALKRFQQEAEAISLLNHPNILTVHDFFISDDGQPYLIMDYLEGTNLDELIKRKGHLDVAEALPIFIMVCSALAHAHEHGIIHRDIKPSNIMLVNQDDKPNFAKIIDFGIAKLTPGEAQERSQLTATGDIFGSPQFMSPEQCRAKPLDARSDIYSLGCVMYFALSGIAPITGDDAMECMYKQVHEIPMLFGQTFPDVHLPEGLEQIISKAVAKEPDDRYLSMNEMCEALKIVYSIVPESSTDYVDQLKATFNSAEQYKEAIQANRTSQKISSKGVDKSIAASFLICLNYLRHMPKNMLYGSIIMVLIISIGLISWFYESRHQAVLKKIEESNQAVRQTVEPNKTQKLSSEQIYSQELQQGEDAFKAGNYKQAEKLFGKAHDTAENFGQRDARYADSLEWQGKTEYQLGNYQVAKQALVYVIYVDKSRYGSNSPKVTAVKKELSEVLRALNQK